MFISFEGLDGCGKSTQLQLLAAALEQQGQKVLVTREPGGTPLGVRLRAALLDVNEQVEPLAELLLYAADRAQHVATVLRPALATGKIVLSDRYADSTVAYQGAGRAFSPEIISQVVTLATGGLKPDLTIILDIPAQESLVRTRRRGANGAQPDRLDSEHADFHVRVREEFLAIAAREPERVRVFDGTLPIKQIAAQISQLVVSKLTGKAHA